MKGGVHFPASSLSEFHTGKSVTIFPHSGNAFPCVIPPRSWAAYGNTKVYKIRKLYRTIFSTFYNILQQNLTMV